MGALDPCLASLVSRGPALPRRKREGARLSPRRLARAIEFMHAHVADDIGVKEIAAAASLSAFHFARAFRNTTGMPPYRCLLQCRVAKVRELLSIGDRSLAQIAAAAGFADQSHMTNVFRRLAGMTPSRYRLNLQVQATPA
jgi:transcriptional regulator GlxA family with amidase domain